MGSGLRFKRSLLFIVGVFMCVTRCNIPRDNVLDPKNPNSLRPRKITIEAFVNTNNPYPYNQYMLGALDSLLKLYHDRVVVAEYHRNTEQDTSEFHLNENELLYLHYLDAVGSSLKGVPDVFINGVDNRIQGASSVQSALFRLQQVILSEMTKNSHFTIELSYQLDSGRLKPEATLARLGSKDVKNILLKAVLVSRMDEVYHKRVVCGSVKSSVIPAFAHGEIKTFTLPELSVDESVFNRLIVYVTDQKEQSIYQCESIEVEQVP